MKILVLVKVIKGEINPFDQCAIEAALTLSGDVTVLSMAPPSAKDALLPLTRLGAKVKMLCDSAFAGSDTLATAYILSCAIKKMEYDLIICGRQSIDGDTAQTGPLLSEMLSVPVITNVLELNCSENEISCRTRLSECEKAPLPALITVERINKLRFPSLRSKVGEVEVLSNDFVGPIMQYPPFAEIINKERINLKNCWFINMDEYLTDNDETIEYESILSFHQIMDNLLYSKIDKDLIMPESQRLFPQPGKEAEIDALFETLGKVDICLTGVGINGHIAFNEPPAQDENITDEEYKNIGTRKLDISKETIVNNGLHKMRGALEIFPRRCVTLGMKQLLKAKVLKVYLYCDWQWGIARKISLQDESRFMPVSFLQSHENSEMVVTKDLYEFML